jgi:hypothetical protein
MSPEYWIFQVNPVKFKVFDWWTTLGGLINGAFPIATANECAR